ncbi:hypothetical protein GCM10028793_47420 [Nocardiopsis oceani]
MHDHDGRGRDDPGKIDPARCRGGGGRRRRWAAHGGLIDTHISYRYHFVIFGFNPIRGSETNATRVCTVLTQERTAVTLAALPAAITVRRMTVPADRARTLPQGTKWPDASSHGGG